METSNLKKLNNVEGKEKYHVEASNKFATLDDFNADGGINTVWESTRENIKTETRKGLGYNELKKLKTWFHRECS
jgi:hypothetical protein